MATPAEIRNRNRSAQSELLGQLITNNGQINTNANAAVNKVLNEKFGQRNALIERRVARQESIAELNKEYVARTQNVLNDKTLDFLIQHSNIDAPTLTSIFAGFELARSSAADKLREERDVEVRRLEALDALDVQRQSVADERLDAAVGLINDTRESSIDDSNRSGTVLVDAAQRDISAADRLEQIETQADRVDARAAAGNASAERRTQITADASRSRRTARQAGTLGFVFENLPPQPEVGALDDENPSQEIEETLVDEVEPVIQPNQQLLTNTDGDVLRDNRATLIDTIIKQPENRSAIDELISIDDQLELTDQERQLSFTLRNLNTVQNVLVDNPEDEQALSAVDILTTQANDQLAQLSPDLVDQQLEEDTQSTIDDTQTDTTAEVQRLNAQLDAVIAIIDNDALEDSQKQDAIRGRVAIEERLSQLAELTGN